MVNASNWMARSLALLAFVAATDAAAFTAVSEADAVDGPVAVAESKAGKPAAAEAAEPEVEGVININEASEQQLALLPGIGSSKARAIVMYRSSKPFSDPRHLVRVRGIGRQTLKQILPYLTVKGPTTLAKKK